MVNQKASKNNIKKSKEKIDYPRLTIKQALQILNKVINQYADIIPYEELALIATGKKVTRGGTFGSITKSLKEYNLMSRSSKTEMKVTELGKRILNSQGIEQKALLRKVFFDIGIFTELLKRYPNLPPKTKALSDFVINRFSLEKREAGRLVNVYADNYHYLDLDKDVEIISDISNEEDYLQEGIEENKKETQIRIKNIANNPVGRIDRETFELIIGVGAITGLGEWEDANLKIKKLAELAKRNNFEGTYGFLNAVLMMHDKEDDLMDKLGRIAPSILELLKSDLKLDHSHSIDKEDSNEVE